MKDHKHGPTKEEQKDLLALLRVCANAPPSHPLQDQTANETTEQEYNGIDGQYNLAVTDLKHQN